LWGCVEFYIKVVDVKETIELNYCAFCRSFVHSDVYTDGKVKMCKKHAEKLVKARNERFER